mmetsp:Transcript_24855/g.52008  ORF Transcript_24855/g.52008 Transcript_24855/m.52008 type:complete len:226 (-) Transcript_24855:952-1629(-)|eukprot:2176472-Pleurochrysis_carterae.AAC.3
MLASVNIPRSSLRTAWHQQQKFLVGNVVVARDVSQSIFVDWATLGKVSSLSRLFVCVGQALARAMVCRRSGLCGQDVRAHPQLERGVRRRRALRRRDEEERMRAQHLCVLDEAEAEALDHFDPLLQVHLLLPSLLLLVHAHSLDDHQQAVALRVVDAVARIGCVRFYDGPEQRARLRDHVGALGRQGQVGEHEREDDGVEAGRGEGTEVARGAVGLGLDSRLRPL